MAITPVPPLTDIPTFPALSDRAAGNYNGMAFAFARHMSDNFNQEIVPVVTSALNNASEAQANALLATQAREQTQLDSAATGQDRVATGADRIQTNLDKLAAQAAAQQIGTAAAFSDNNPIVKGSADPTKRLKIDISSIPTGTDIVAAITKSGTVAMTADIPAIVPSGLVLLATIAPTAVANLDFPNVFTTAYDNYLIIGNRVNTSSPSLLFRVFTGGSTIVTSASYGSQRPANATATALPIDTSTSMDLSPGGQINFEIRVSRLVPSLWLFESTAMEVISGQSIRQATSIGGASTAVAITGIRLFPSTGNFSAIGTVRVYGIAN